MLGLWLPLPDVFRMLQAATGFLSPTTSVGRPSPVALLDLFRETFLRWHSPHRYLHAAVAASTFATFRHRCLLRISLEQRRVVEKINNRRSLLRFLVRQLPSQQFLSFPALAPYWFVLGDRDFLLLGARSQTDASFLAPEAISAWCGQRAIWNRLLLAMAKWWLLLVRTRAQRQQLTTLAGVVAAFQQWSHEYLVHKSRVLLAAVDHVRTEVRRLESRFVRLVHYRKRIELLEL